MRIYTSGNLPLHAARKSLKLDGPDLEMHLLWCRTGICSWNISVAVPLMLDDPFPVLFFCNLKPISLCIIQKSMKITSTQLVPFSVSPTFETILGVLGHSLNSNIAHKFLCEWPLFPDYLSISCSYAVIKSCLIPVS